MDRLRLSSFGFLIIPTFVCVCVCERCLASCETCHTFPAGTAPPAAPEQPPLKNCFVTTLFFFTCSWLEMGRLFPSLRLAGISHTLVTPPQLSLPPVKGHGVSGPAVGQELAGWRVLLTSGLLMCGLVYVNWEEAL